MQYLTIILAAFVAGALGAPKTKAAGTGYVSIMPVHPPSSSFLYPPPPQSSIISKARVPANTTPQLRLPRRSRLRPHGPDQRRRPPGVHRPRRHHLRLLSVAPQVRQRRWRRDLHPRLRGVEGLRDLSKAVEPRPWGPRPWWEGEADSSTNLLTQSPWAFFI